MKSEIFEKIKTDSPFPKLRNLKDQVRGNLVLLFVKESSGAVVYEDGMIIYTLGEFRETWMDEDFEDFNGFLTLSN